VVQPRVAVRVERRAVDRAVLADAEELADDVVELVVGGRDPVVVLAVGLLPVEPDLPRIVGEQVLLGEAVHLGEPERPLADEQAVIGPLHDQPGDGGGVHDVPDRGDRASSVGRAVHDGGIEFDDAFLVRDAAVADGPVLRIGLDDRDAGDRRVERVGAGLEQLHRLLDGPQAVGAGDDDGSSRADRLLGRGADHRRGTQAEGARGEEGSAVQVLFE